MTNRTVRRAILVTMAATATILLSTSCGKKEERTPRPTEAASLEEIAGTVWVLRWWDREEPALLQAEVTLAYADGRFGGSSGCNDYFSGVEEKEPGVIQVGLGGATQKMCPDPQMEVERRYMKLLGSAHGLAITGGELEIHYEFEGKEGVLIFKAREPGETE